MKDLAAAAQVALKKAEDLESTKPLFDFGGRHKNSIKEARGRASRLQVQIDEQEKATAMAAEKNKQPTFFQRLFGASSSTSPASIEQSNITVSASPNRPDGWEMSESDKQTINGYISSGYKYEGVKDGFYVLRKGRDVVNITA